MAAKAAAAMRLVLAAGLAWIAQAGCAGGGDEATTTDKPAEPAAAAPRTPPHLYLTATDRLARLAQLDGQIRPAPDGDWWLQASVDGRPDAGATYCVYDCRQATPAAKFTVTAAALRAADDRPADAALLVRVTDAGWLWYRSAPAGAQPTAGGDFPPAAQAGEWRRFYPNTGRGRPVWNGYRVTALAPRLRFAIAIPAAAGQPAVVLDLQYAVASGVLRWTPLPEPLAELPGPEAAAAIAAIGDDGAILCVDGRMFSAGPAGDSNRPAVELETLTGLTGLAAWDGAGWRLQRQAAGNTAWTLQEPPTALALPAGVTRWLHGGDWLAVESPEGLAVIAADGSQPFRWLPIPVGERLPSLNPAAGEAEGLSPRVDRHLTALTGGKRQLLVFSETDAAGQVTSLVYRWDRLR